MYWTRDEIVKPTHITIDQRNDIINEFHAINPNGSVVI